MTRIQFLAIAILILAAAWFGPLPHMASSRFAAHMALHLILIAAAAPFLAFAASGTRLEVGLLAVGLLNPVLTSLVELGAVWAWHAPSLHEASRAYGFVFAVEQGSFLLAGVLLWLSVLGSEGHRTRRAALGVFALLLTSMHMTLLGALLIFARRPLYAHHAAAEGAVGGALADQQLGGVLMLTIGGVVYLVAGLWLLARVLEERSRPGTLA